MICLVASKPFMTGMLISMVTTSGCSRFVISAASRPFFAVPAITISGSALSTACSSSRTVTESSAMSTRIIWASENLADHPDQTSLVECTLQEIGIRPRLQAAQLVLLGFPGGDENDWQVPQALGAPDRLGQLEAVHRSEEHTSELQSLLR